MAREHIEVSVEVLHVDIEMGYSLRAVDEHGYSVTMGLGNHGAGRIDRSEDV